MTGELLVSHDVERRQAEQHDPQLLNPLRKHWNDIEPLLTDRSPLQRRILAVRLQRGQVDGLELSELRSILRTLRAPPLVAPIEPALLEPRAQLRWYGRRDLLNLHRTPADDLLLSRLNTMTLVWTDEPRLAALRAAAVAAALPDLQRLRLAQHPELVNAVTPELRDEFRTAVKVNSFPPRLRVELTRIAEVYRLDPATLSPVTLSGRTRSILRRTWPLVSPVLGEQSAGLHRALETGRYTLAEAHTLTAALTLNLPGVLVDERERCLLLDHVALWTPRCPPEDAREIVASLHRRRYGPVFAMWQPALVPFVRETLAGQAQQRRTERHRVAVNLQNRLRQRWSALRPVQAKALGAVDPEVLAVELESACRQFEEDATITLDLERNVLAALDRLSGTKSA